jgi:hypothetical protein
LLQKLANQTSEDEFTKCFIEGNFNEITALKISSAEMVLIKGGWTLMGLARAMIGNAGQDFAFKVGLDGRVQGPIGKSVKTIGLV